MNKQESDLRKERPTGNDVHVIKGVINRYLLPLLHLADIEGPHARAVKTENGISEMGCKSVNLHFPQHSNFSYSLTRDVAFTPREQEILRCIMEKIWADNLNTENLNHVYLCNAIEHAIARQLSPECMDTILNVFHIYEQWAVETYEGNRVAHTVGIYCKSAVSSDLNFHDYRNSSVFKVLGGMSDTILTLNKTGSVIGVETVSAKQGSYRKNQNVLAPISMADLALWTTSSGKIVLKLCSNGEILVFQDKQLVYAKRRSYWRAFPSTSTIHNLFSASNSIYEENSKMAIYLTSLDLAFSGSGGCLGMLQNDTADADARNLSNGNMLFSSTSPTNTIRLIRTLVDSARFPEIPRRVRLWLCSLDGATLMDSHGALLTAGAILRITGNPFQGGGRTAAAQTLGGYGLGIKVSADGFVEIYQGDSPPLLFA